MSREDTGKLITLREKLAKNEEDHGKLKEAIQKEEKRILEKEKRDKERWWKELTREMEKLLMERLGPEYRNQTGKETILTILKEHLPEMSGSRETENPDLGKNMLSSDKENDCQDDHWQEADYDG